MPQGLLTRPSITHPRIRKVRSAPEAVSECGSSNTVNCREGGLHCRSHCISVFYSWQSCLPFFFRS